MKPDPQAVKPDALEVHVIAGSVVTLTPPGVCSQAYGSDGQPILDGNGDPVLVAYDQDRWTSDNRLERDDSWYYKTTFSDGERLSPLPEDVWRSERAVTWQAPTSDCTVTATTYTLDTIWSSSEYGSNDAAVTYASMEIHVHELEVYEVYRGVADIHYAQAHPLAEVAGGPHPDECDYWDNSATAVPSLRYRRGDFADPMLFSGQTVAEITVVLRGKGGWTGTVVPANLQLYAPWPREQAPVPEYPGGAGIRLMGPEQCDVSALPLQVPVTSRHWGLDIGGTLESWYTCPIDQRVTLDEPYAWNWDCRVFGGQDYLGEYEWEYESVCPVDDATFPWVATAYGSVPAGESTPVRVSYLFPALDGLDDRVALADAVVDWVAAGLHFGDRNWVDEGGAPEDVWCMICSGDGIPGEEGWESGAADCISGARVAVQALDLVGVSAEAAYIYLQHTEGALDPALLFEYPWRSPDDCPSPGHDGHLIGYWVGNSYNIAEGAFRLGGFGLAHTDDKWWTVFPARKGWDHPGVLICDIVRASGGEYGCQEYADTGNGYVAVGFPYHHPEFVLPF